MRYSVKISQNKYGALKIIILGICLLLDLIAIASVIGAIATKTYSDIALYVAIMAGVLCIQIASTFLTYSLEYRFDDGVLTIDRVFPMLRQQIFKGEKGSYSLMPLNTAANMNVKTKDKNAVRLCINTCPYAIYMLELSGKKYIVNLDDYLYAIATEDENDIS